MDEKNTLLDSLEDAAGTLFLAWLLFGLVLGVFAIVGCLLKWLWQAVEWSARTESKARWIILAPIMTLFMPFWLVWMASKWCTFQMFRLFLRTLIISRRLFF